MKSFFFPYFRRSFWAGLGWELGCFGMAFGCSLLLSRLLEAVTAGRLPEVVPLALATLGTLTLTLVPRYGLTLFRERTALVEAQRCREALYRRILDLTLPAADGGQLEVLLEKDLPQVAEYYQRALPAGMGSMVITLCAGGLLCLANWQVGLTLCLMDLTQLLPVIVYEGWAKRIYQRTRSDEEDYCAWMLEGHNGRRTLKAYGAENWYMARYREKCRAICRSGRQAEEVGAVERVLYAAIDTLLRYGSLLVVGAFLLSGALAVTQAPLFLVLSGHLFNAMEPMFDLRLASIACREAQARLAFWDPPIAGKPGGAVLTAKDVQKSFDGKSVLQGATITVNSGDRILLQGDNGSGKSTLLSILAGWTAPDVGRVLAEGRESWACLPQTEPELTLTGREILSAIPGLDHGALRNALDGFQIRQLLDRPLDRLSGGERKKLYLAAALSKRAPVLLLDEPGNHLDSASLEFLAARLREYDGTVLLCAHGALPAWGHTRTIRMEGGVCHEY